MNNQNNKKKQWHLITYEDPNFLHGTSIYNMIDTIQKILEIRYIAICNIQGFGKPGEILKLQDLEGEIISIEKVTCILKDIEAFEFGDFFLFQKSVDDWDDSLDLDFPYLINQTNTTIRAIDRQYIYVYTPYESVVQIIKENYNIESLKTDFLDDLDFPY